MDDILVVGSLNADLVVRILRFPAAGETIHGEDLRIIPGGKGANQAVAAARLGARVAMIGRVGRDTFGSGLVDNLEHNHVAAHLVRRDEDASTGTAIVLVDANGENRIVISPGANGKLSPADVQEDALRSTRLLLLQLEIPDETVLHAARLARQSGVKILLNPAPARALTDELIRLADFLLPNESELSLLTGQACRDTASVETAARSLLDRGAQAVLVTRGERGAFILTQDLAQKIPPFQVKAVDTTGAGDAFIGGFAVMLLQGKSPEQAAKYACACGALAVTKFGAQSSLPTREEVNKFLDSQPAR